MRGDEYWSMDYKVRDLNKPIIELKLEDYMRKKEECLYDLIISLLGDDAVEFVEIFAEFKKSYASNDGSVPLKAQYDEISGILKRNSIEIVLMPGYKPTPTSWRPMVTRVYQNNELKGEF